jgi:hypothetical protein
MEIKFEIKIELKNMYKNFYYKMSSNPFNPSWHGFSPATDKQIMSGSAPYVYNYMSHDSSSCITAKSMFNTAHSAMYTPDSIVRSHPSSALIQSSMLKSHENTIKDVCHPSFSIDTNTISTPFNHSAFGMPNGSFS